MGYWSQGEAGDSFNMDSDLVWGDAPADVMDEAIDKIVRIFQEDVGRLPTQNELVAGVRFSCGYVEGVKGELL